MFEPWYVLSCIAVSAAITWTMRAVPFAMLKPLRRSSLLAYLGEHMPVGIMLILAVYTVRDIDLGHAPSIVSTIAGLAVTVSLHLWRGNMMLSIFGGTAVYVAIASSAAAAG